MPIEPLTKTMYEFVKYRNDRKLNTYTANLHVHSYVKGYNRRESGYAIQELKKKGLLRIAPNGEWVALQRR